jgi:hypothetical protein
MQNCPRSAVDISYPSKVRDGEQYLSLPYDEHAIVRLPWSKAEITSHEIGDGNRRPKGFLPSNG